MRGWLAGVDEAGRGPLAGPVVAAAVILDRRRPIAGLRDSKALTPEARAYFNRLIRKRAVCFAVAEASVEEIDAINILQASLLAMRRALLQLVVAPHRIMIDGNKAPQLHDIYPDCEVATLVGGDDREPTISAASILAKTYRDALMVQLDEQYPGYGLWRHFGYCTLLHRQALRRLGPSPIHRRSFEPVRLALETTMETSTLAIAALPAA
jgi:ribonuclease HII